MGRRHKRQAHWVGEVRALRYSKECACLGLLKTLLDTGERLNNLRAEDFQFQLMHSLPRHGGQLYSNNKLKATGSSWCGWPAFRKCYKTGDLCTIG